GRPRADRRSAEIGDAGARTRSAATKRWIRRSSTGYPCRTPCGRRAEVLMETIELQLDERTLENARQLAEARHLTVEDLLKETLSRLFAPSKQADPILRLFADQPQLFDQIVEEAMQAR